MPRVYLNSCVFISADLTLGPNDKKRVDFFFVVDISASLGNENFIKAFDFVTTFINRVSVINQCSKNLRGSGLS